MGAGIVGSAIGLFAVTNLDDLVVLALFFGQGSGELGSTRRIVAGQYLGFTAILAVALAAALGATFLPESAIAYLGLLPLALGLRALWKLRPGSNDTTGEVSKRKPGGPNPFDVAAVTFANGGDNIGVYVPVFVTAGLANVSIYVLLFLILLAGWIAAGRYVATRPLIAKGLTRWGHILVPLVFIAIGARILVDGHAFGV